jgi:hypothetical protein
VDFGDGTTSKDINPIKTYVNGTYKVVLEIRILQELQILMRIR